MKGRPPSDILLAVVFSAVFSLSCVLTSLSHPVSMGLALISMAFFSSVFLGKIFSSWVFYLLLLVFLGGVMVALSFMVSVCANEKFFYARSAVTVSAFFILTALVVLSGGSLPASSGAYSSNLVTPLYQKSSAGVFVAFMLILVLCLVSVVNISKLESGPLVKRL